jgi:phosphoribosylaminoimidazolecarboxamide formyltransferase/IMP cyclohydrolase
MSTSKGVLAPLMPDNKQLETTVVVVGRLEKTFPKGENGWQVPAGLYETCYFDELAISHFQLKEGKEPSHNNVCDLDRALQTLTHVTEAFRVNNYKVPLVAIGNKHGNPCGASFTHNLETNGFGALRRMIAGDPLAIFGGTAMTNFTIREEHVDAFFNEEKKVLLDSMIAPDILSGAIEQLKRREGKCRFLYNQSLSDEYLLLDATPRMRQVRGGFTLQDNYINILNVTDSKIEKHGPKATPDKIHDLLFAWAICATSNSNTITIVNNRQLIGNGVGQQARIYAAELAVSRAKRHGHQIEGAVAVSDSFFPFNDAVQHLIDAGVKMLFTTSGSNNDQNVRDLCQEHGITLWMMPDEDARMFFGH